MWLTASICDLILLSVAFGASAEGACIRIAGHHGGDICGRRSLDVIARCTVPRMSARGSANRVSRQPARPREAISVAEAVAPRERPRGTRFCSAQSARAWHRAGLTLTYATIKRTISRRGLSKNCRFC